MLNTAALCAFTATAKPAEALDFYQNVLGLPLIEDGDFSLTFDANGTTLRIQKVQAVSPAYYTSLGWHVADIRSDVEHLAAKGVTFERFDGMPQDDAGIWSAPGGALVAWFRDPDGNLLSLTQYPAS